MFNVSKKTLSVVLCLALLLSVVAVCFMTPATAKTVTNTESFTTYKDLSSKEAVELTFDANDEEGQYGIPFGRGGAKVSYTDGYALSTKSGGWFFMGNNNSKSVSTVEAADNEPSDKDTVVADNLFLFEAGKSYIVTVDYKYLAGSVVSSINLGFKLAVNPNQGGVGDDSDMFSSISRTGHQPSWKVNGVAQENGTTLTADTDMQTATIGFTVATSGYLGMQNNSSSSAVNLAIDNVKIYVPTQETTEKITFDNGSHGIGAIRYGGAAEYATENGNRYGVLNLTGKNVSTYLANTEYSSSYRITAATDLTDATKLAEIDAAYSKMFKFKPGVRYEVSFKYRVPSTQPEDFAETELRFKLMADPLGQALNDDLNTSGTGWAKDVVIEGNTLGESDVWQDCKVIFTVKTLEETGNAQIRTNTDAPYDFDGAYFGFVGTKFVLHVDDYEVKEIDTENSTNISVTTDYVYHDMEDYTAENNIATNKTGDVGSKFVMNKYNDASLTNKNTTFVDANDGTTHGKVLHIVGSSQARGTFGDSGVFEKGKKYYISFDARSNSGATQTMALYLANLYSMTSDGGVNSNFAGSQQNPRLGFSASNAPFKYYINGEETTFANFVTLGTDWQHYGIVIDFTDETITSSVETAAGTYTASGTDVTYKFFDAPKYFYFGVDNSYYDNFRIVSTHDVDGAVPETEGGDSKYLSETYESTTASEIKASSTASVSDGVVSVTKGRFTFTDSGIITAGNKYTISFDAKLGSGTEAYMTMIVSYLSSGGDKPRYFINNGTDGSAAASSTNMAVRKAFKFYIVDENGEKVETALANYKVTDTWQTFVVEFDYTDADFLAATEVEFAKSNPAYMGQLTKDVNYFHVGCDNGMFKNFKIVEETIGVQTEVSYREASGTGENYLSAGLRFKASMSTDAANNAAEIGFVVAPSTHASMTENWYRLEKGLNKIARQGVVKSAAQNKNIVYASDEDITDYQMVITGLSAEVEGNPEGKTAFNRRYSAVLYTKDAEGNYSYYALGEASYYQILGISETLKAQ